MRCANCNLEIENDFKNTVLIKPLSMEHSK